MNSQNVKLILNDIGPKKLTHKYNYNQVCEDIEQINRLLNKEVLKIVEINNEKLYSLDKEYQYNSYYEHLASETKEIPKLKKEFKKIISRYYNFLCGYYFEVYGVDVVTNIGMLYKDTFKYSKCFCDCCVKMWANCQCFCSNCGDVYKYCKSECYDTVSNT